MMHPEIQKLFDQCGVNEVELRHCHNGHTFMSHTSHMEKFAELIIEKAYKEWSTDETSPDTLRLNYLNDVSKSGSDDADVWAAWIGGESSVRMAIDNAMEKAKNG